MQELRKLQLENARRCRNIDRALALSGLHIDHLDKTIIEQTLGVVLKDWERYKTCANVAQRVDGKDRHYF